MPEIKFISFGINLQSYILLNTMYFNCVNYANSKNRRVNLVSRYKKIQKKNDFYTN